MIHEPPVLLSPPGSGFYVAINVPYDLFYDGKGYYLYDDGTWFSSANYQGPWVFVDPKVLPKGLQGKPVGDLRSLRDLQARKYKEKGSDYHGRVLVAPPTANQGSRKHLRHAR